MDNIFSDFGIGFMEDEIDEVIFKTNEFLGDATFIGSTGAFWYIAEMCMALAAVFSIIVASNIAYKMLVKHEGLDILKLFKPIAVAVVLCWWYPPAAGTGWAGNVSTNTCVLDILAYIPNAIGSYTHDLYEAEADQLEDKFDELQWYIAKRDSLAKPIIAKTKATEGGVTDSEVTSTLTEETSPSEVIDTQVESHEMSLIATEAGLLMCADKIIIIAALIVFRIGWWATIYCQQILLGVLTVFGPIQWAFSILPKWEGAWAKWIIRYLTVHFFGAMLYFVGFYVLLLYDIAMCIQVENLATITQSEETMASAMQSGGTFLISAGYLMAASVVAVRCLNLVPDLATWMIPEGEVSFSARSFGEGVATQSKTMILSAISKLT